MSCLASIANREDKMGFPTPFNLWARGPARDFVWDLMRSEQARTREYFDNERALRDFETESTYGRGFWGLCRSRFGNRPLMTRRQ